VGGRLPHWEPPKVTAKAYSQRSARWANEPLGTASGKTIGAAGCAICAVASGLYDLGIETNPLFLNCWLDQHGGYSDGNDFVWQSVERLGVKLEALVNCRFVAAPMALIAAALKAGKVVVAEVDSEPGGDLQPHFVRILSLTSDYKDGGIMDPWQLPGAELCKLSDHYEASGWDAARAIFMVAVYSKV
jgi:hypothetical protein